MKFKIYELKLQANFMGEMKNDKETNLCFPKLSIGCIFCALNVHGTNAISTILSKNVSLILFENKFLYQRGLVFRVIKLTKI